MDYRKYTHLWFKKIEYITLDELKLLKEMNDIGFVPIPDTYSVGVKMSEWVETLKREWESKLG